MRMIFEQDAEEDMLELVLSESDMDKINSMRGATKDFTSLLGNGRSLNVFIRKELQGEKICL